MSMTSYFNQHVHMNILRREFCIKINYGAFKKALYT
jgi:hypothetical protein